MTLEIYGSFFIFHAIYQQKMIYSIGRAGSVSYLHVPSYLSCILNKNEWLWIYISSATCWCHCMSVSLSGHRADWSAPNMNLTLTAASCALQMRFMCCPYWGIFSFIGLYRHSEVKSDANLHLCAATFYQLLLGPRSRRFFKISGHQTINLKCFSCYGMVAPLTQGGPT